ncbi:MAG: hypothetical protein Q8Q74_14825 [Polaromonas sp.]|nr:hypothetical protein [Polaromonas sp.]
MTTVSRSCGDEAVWEKAGHAAATTSESAAERACDTQVFMRRNIQQKALTGFPAGA